MVSNRRLLVLSCSQRKRFDPGLMPAIERYDGPAFRVLRRFLREQPECAEQLDVWILSAAYGLIPADFPTPEYDQVMTSQRAAELREEVLAAFIKRMNAGYGELCLVLSKKYFKALEGWSTLVPQGVSVTIADGPQGVKLKQLRYWLWKDRDENDENDCRQQAEVRGVARLRGVELQFTPAQVLEVARAMLEKDKEGASRFRQWYVEVDGYRVAPKWLVSKLTGLPVSDFTAGEARRVLHHLGIHTRRLSEDSQ